MTRAVLLAMLIIGSVYFLDNLRMCESLLC